MEELTFGQRIVSFRVKKHMLQKELAEKAEISPTALNYYEKDKREPNVLVIKKIAKALNITGDELLGMDTVNITVQCNQDEKGLIEKYRHLNQEGQAKVINYINDLIATEKYANTIFRAAKSDDNTPPQILKVSDERIKKLEDAPETDEI